MNKEELLNFLKDYFAKFGEGYWDNMSIVINGDEITITRNA